LALGEKVYTKLKKFSVFFCLFLERLPTVRGMIPDNAE